jgi:hypothetical protein
LITKTLQNFEVIADKFNINIMLLSRYQEERDGNNDDDDTGNSNILLSTVSSNKKF